ncbi:MAG: hypothetical protein ABI433_06850 [Burkholderiaceae bacterium]
MKVFKWLWRVVRGVMLALAAVVLLIEEWGWRPLTAWAARLAQWPPIARLEARIVAVQSRWALVLFLLPAVLLFPIKLLALWLIHKGSAMLGVSVIVAAKLLGTALVGRLFILTEPQLMQIAWFARAIRWWRETKARVKVALAESALWRGVRSVARRWRVRIKRLVRG